MRVRSLLILLLLLAPLRVTGQDAPAVEPDPVDAAETVDQLVELLDADDYATRQRAHDRLLADNSLGEVQIKAALNKPHSEEQRQRLLLIAEHHVMRAIREKQFAARHREPAAIGFSYEQAQAGEGNANPGDGVTVLATMPGFPGHALLRPGDTITAIDGQAAAHRPRHMEVTTWVSWRISLRKPGDRTEFYVQRNGQAKSIIIICAEGSALKRMYSTDGLKAAVRAMPYERLWLSARARLTDGLPQPKALKPAE